MSAKYWNVQTNNGLLTLMTNDEMTMNDWLDMLVDFEDRSTYLKFTLILIDHDTSSEMSTDILIDLSTIKWVSGPYGPAQFKVKTAQTPQGPQQHQYFTRLPMQMN